MEAFAIPKGSTVLVTGVNGLIGSHIANQFLEHGYNVRGTVRDLGANNWVVSAFEKFGNGRFELVKVVDMNSRGAFDEAIKGVSVIVHTAADMGLKPDPNESIPITIAGVTDMMKTAYAEKSFKRFVYTSSSAAVVVPAVGGPALKVTEDTWNEDAVKAAWKGPPFAPENAFTVYAACKTQTEQAVWKFFKEHREERPDVIVNTVIPSVTLGNPIDPVNQGYRTTSELIPALWRGEFLPLHHIFVRQYFVNVQDAARLHVAAAILPHVEGKRIFAFANRFNWDKVLALLRKMAPERQFPDDFSGGEDPIEIGPRDEAEKLLRDLGRPGWTSLEDTVAANIQGLR